MLSRFFRVALEEIAYVRAILEGYDGLGLLRAIDPRRGEIELLIAEGRESEAGAVILLLQKEVGFIEIARPEDWPKS